MGYRQSSKLFLKRHYLAILFAIVVGVMSVAPRLLLINSLGDSYKGIHLTYPDDNSYYMARMQDIIDGHWFVSSPFIYEYKNQRPLVYPVGEYFYALPSILFNIPLVDILVFNKFLFPFALFLLSYALVYLLTGKPDYLSGKFNAIAGGLLVTLGYNFVDYKNTFLKFAGDSGAVSLIWTRPVNPATGAVLIFIFLYFLWLYISSRKTKHLVFSAVTFSLMVGYFFTWSLSLAIALTLAVIFLLGGRYSAAKRVGYVILLGFLLSASYWHNTLQFLNSGSRDVVSARNGMIFTHEPIYNKILLIATLLFFSALLIEYRKCRREGIKISLSWSFNSALILGGLFALNQQIITGKTIWPYHFVQYTIPLSFIVFAVTLFNLVRPRWPHIWRVVIILAIAIMILYGTISVAGFRSDTEKFRKTQRYGDILHWLQANAEKDCVVLVREGLEERLTRLIPSFTRCNVYSTQWILFGVNASEDRIRHNILTTIRINGIRSNDAEGYLKENSFFLRDYMFRDWLDYTRSDIADEDVKRRKDIVQDYADFVKKDFTASLKRYKIDYIASDGAIDSSTLESLPLLTPRGEFNGIYLYKI